MNGIEIAILGILGAGMLGAWIYVFVVARKAEAEECTDTTAADSQEDCLQGDGVVSIGDLQAALNEFILSQDLRKSMSHLGSVLPSVIRHQAENSRRSVPDIVRDLFDRIVEGLEINWERPSELRLAQSGAGITEVWVAAYPFLDHISAEHHGMYETVRNNLLQGTRYIYFQPDRKYFDILRERLGSDPEVTAAKTVLDQSDPQCRLCFVETPQKLLQRTTFSIWNPLDSAHMEARVLPPQQHPIRVVLEDGVWKLTSSVTMLPIASRAQAQVLYEELEPLYRSALSSGQQKRRSAGA